MALRRIGLRCLATAALGAVAPLALAQMGSSGVPGMRGHGRGDPALRDCRTQADERQLPAGEQRRKFIHQCVELERGGAAPAKGATAHATTRDPPSGHLHSDPPPALTTPRGP
jgi:hypothetical protein